MPSILLLVLLAAMAAAPAPLDGLVSDPSGAPIADASVRVESSGIPVAETRTSGDGRFSLAALPPGSLRIVVTAAGFAQTDNVLTLDAGPLRLTLYPAPFFEAVSVTSSRTDVPRADPTSTMTVISGADLLASAPVAIDDALKAVPGFTLFRRTSSRTANPTTQGIALRGVGGTAQSRSLVMVDGVPLNDAFGGWVYWDKVPQVAIDRVEIQRGSGSDLYGADAVGGVVQLLTLRPPRPTGRALLEAGNLGTGRISLFGGGRTAGWRYSGGGEWFTIDGYVPVAIVQEPGIAPRGPIDGRFGSAHRSSLASTGHQTSTGWRFDATASVFSEDRRNGTPLSYNTTASRLGALETAGPAGHGFLSVRAFGGTQDYHQTFTTINAARTTEALNRDQNIPTTSAGVGGQWIRPWGRHTLLAGAEARYVDGSSNETPYSQGRALQTVEAGGTQRLGSAFLQDTVTLGRTTVVLGAHGDSWHSESQVTGYAKSYGALNPRVAAAVRMRDGFTLRGAVYHGFRAPTLNEFYRNFSSGNTQTRPNEALGPEQLTGADVGVLVQRGGASARVTGFWNVLDDAITTVTLSSTPQLIVRQRANADTLRAMGLELEGDWRLAGGLTVSGAAGLISSRFKAGTSLQNKRAPQVPGYNVATGVRYAHGGWSGSAQLRVTGAQFEDDLNLFTLRRATVLDLFGGRTVARRFTLFVGIENAADAVYDVGRTPILTTGLPRAARVGLLLSLP